MRRVVSVLAAVLAVSSFAGKANADEPGSWKIWTQPERCNALIEWTKDSAKYGLAIGYLKKGKDFLLVFTDTTINAKTRTPASAEFVIDGQLDTKAQGFAQGNSVAFMFKGDAPIVASLGRAQELAFGITIGEEKHAYNFSTKGVEPPVNALQMCRPDSQ